MIKLTRREREIAQLVAQGYSNQEIATKLGISICTVKNHLQRIFWKLRITNRTQLALRVREPAAIDDDRSLCLPL
jgi:DNA-binding NarL/FixJ family response regulator